MIKSPDKKIEFWNIALIAIAAILGIALFIYVCFFPLFPSTSWMRKQRVKQYSPDNIYSVISGKARVIYFEKSEIIYVKLTVEDVLIDNNGKDDYYEIGYEYEYQFISSNRKVLEENGLKDILGSEETTEYRATFYNVTQTVTMTVTQNIWGDGMRPFAVGLKTNDKEYLSYETGKANLLYYFLHEMY